MAALECRTASVHYGGACFYPFNCASKISPSLLSVPNCNTCTGAWGANPTLATATENVAACIGGMHPPRLTCLHANSVGVHSCNETRQNRHCDSLHDNQSLQWCSPLTVRTGSTCILDGAQSLRSLCWERSARYAYPAPEDQRTTRSPR